MCTSWTVYGRAVQEERRPADLATRRVTRCLHLPAASKVSSQSTVQSRDSVVQGYQRCGNYLSCLMHSTSNHMQQLLQKLLATSCFKPKVWATLLLFMWLQTRDTTFPATARNDLGEIC